MANLTVEGEGEEGNYYVLILRFLCSPCYSALPNCIVYISYYFFRAMILSAFIFIG